MNIPRAGIAAAVVVLLLSGCATDPEPADPPVAETPSESPAPEPTKPALDELMLTTEGLDYLKVDLPVEERDAGESIVTWVDDYCDVNEIPAYDAWVADYPEGDNAFVVFKEPAKGAPILRIVAKSPEISTEAGIHFGSTEAEVTAAYPNARLLTDTADIHRYVVDGYVGQLVIEVALADTWGTPPGTVTYLFASSNGDSGFANTGGPYTCA